MLIVTNLFSAITFYFVGNAARWRDHWLRAEEHRAAISNEYSKGWNACKEIRWKTHWESRLEGYKDAYKNFAVSLECIPTYLNEMNMKIGELVKAQDALRKPNVRTSRRSK